MTPHIEGYLPCPLVETWYFLQPFVEAEGGKDELRQHVTRGPFVVPRNGGLHLLLGKTPYGLAN
jgi:hypothetical protein